MVDYSPEEYRESIIKAIARRETTVGWWAQQIKRAEEVLARYRAGLSVALKSAYEARDWLAEWEAKHKEQNYERRR